MTTKYRGEATHTGRSVDAGTNAACSLPLRLCSDRGGVRRQHSTVQYSTGSTAPEQYNRLNQLNRPTCLSLFSSSSRSLRRLSPRSTSRAARTCFALGQITKSSKRCTLFHMLLTSSVVLSHLLGPGASNPTLWMSWALSRNQIKAIHEQSVRLCSHNLLSMSNADMHGTRTATHGGQRWIRTATVLSRNYGHRLLCIPDPKAKSALT